MIHLSAVYRHVCTSPISSHLIAIRAKSWTHYHLIVSSLPLYHHATAFTGRRYLTMWSTVDECDTSSEVTGRDHVVYEDEFIYDDVSADEVDSPASSSDDVDRDYEYFVLSSPVRTTFWSVASIRTCSQYWGTRRPKSRARDAAGVEWMGQGMGRGIWLTRKSGGAL